MFVNHIYATTPKLPPFGEHLCEYVTAANGVFVRARRPGLEAMLPLGPDFEPPIRGLATLEPFIRLEHGRIPSAVIGEALDWMSQAVPLELLVWISWENGYQAVMPVQQSTAHRCAPLDPFDLRGQKALMDFHSHGAQTPFFSKVDDRDEQHGFRLLAVFGCFPLPSVVVRAGIFGHFWTIPPEWVMQLPAGLFPAEKDPKWR